MKAGYKKVSERRGTMTLWIFIGVSVAVIGGVVVWVKWFVR